MGERVLAAWITRGLRHRQRQRKSSGSFARRMQQKEKGHSSSFHLADAICSNITWPTSASSMKFEDCWELGNRMGEIRTV